MANNDKNNKNGKGRSNLRGILTLVAWALVLTVAFNYFAAYNSNATNKATSHEIKYSEMVSLIEGGKVDEVLFKDDAIYITPVEGYTYTEERREEGEKGEKIVRTRKQVPPNASAIALWLSHRMPERWGNGAAEVPENNLLALLREELEGGEDDGVSAVQSEAAAGDDVVAGAGGRGA